jgi:integrase
LSFGQSYRVTPNVIVGKTPEIASPPLASLTRPAEHREHLTPDEVERMIAAARQAGGRVAERDALLIMMAYRHGLRASELAALRRDQIDLKAGRFMLHVARMAHPQLIRSEDPRGGRCARGNGSRTRCRPTCLRRCVVVR